MQNERKGLDMEPNCPLPQQENGNTLQLARNPQHPLRQWAVCGLVGFATSFAAKATPLQYEGTLGADPQAAAHPRTPVAGAATCL